MILPHRWSQESSEASSGAWQGASWRPSSSWQGQGRGRRRGERGRIRRTLTLPQIRRGKRLRHNLGRRCQSRTHNSGHYSQSHPRKCKMLGNGQKGGEQSPTPKTIQECGRAWGDHGRNWRQRHTDEAAAAPETTGNNIYVKHSAVRGGSGNGRGHWR